MSHAEVAHRDDDEELVSAEAEVEEEEDAAMEEVEDQEGYTSSTPTSTLTWISWFCSLPGHEYFCEVAEDFIEDDFNLTGLAPYVPFWKEALEMVLDVDPDPEEDTSKIPDVSIVEQSAEILYGLVHARYILTRAGLQTMVEKYESGMFGSCPRVYCMGTHVVPCGRTDVPALETVKLYCPNCHDIYTPPSSRFQSIDAAYFGTTFPHVFFQSYRELAPAPIYKGLTRTLTSASNSRASSHAPPPSSASSTNAPSATPSSPANPTNPHGGQRHPHGLVYVPRIYGFRVSERAKSGPRMQWLRLRPSTVEELNSVDWRGRFIDDEEEDEDDYDEEDEDRPMEDFDPDAADEDTEEEDQSEEEAEGGGAGGPAGIQRGVQAYTTSPAPSRPAGAQTHFPGINLPQQLVCAPASGKVKVVRQRMAQT